MRKTTFMVSLLSALALGAGPAGAHASLDHSSPPVGGTVAAPNSVTLWFTERLEPKFSSVTVTGPGGKRASGGVSVSGNRMSASVRNVGPGTYRVHWKVLSVDTHTTSGNFTFQVGR
jgi:copper resistance protein C